MKDFGATLIRYTSILFHLAYNYSPKFLHVKSQLCQLIMSTLEGLKAILHKLLYIQLFTKAPVCSSFNSVIKSGEDKRQRFRQLNFNKFLDACWCTFTVSIIYF